MGVPDTTHLFFDLREHAANTKKVKISNEGKRKPI